MRKNYTSESGNMPILKWHIVFLFVSLFAIKVSFLYSHGRPLSINNDLALSEGKMKHERYRSSNSAPVFNSSNYSFVVSEQAAISASVGKITATDPDEGALTYSIRSGNTNRSFTINASTGLITVAKWLNHHTQNKFTITVRVTDNGGLTDDATVVITVQAATVPSFSSITWSTAASSPYGTHEVHGEVVNGKLYTFGGFDELKRPQSTPTKRAFVFDPTANTWTPIADLPYTPNDSNFGGVSHQGLCTDGTDIYMAGGYPSNSAGTGQTYSTKQVWKYNVSSNTYTALPNLPIALATGQMRYLQGKLHYMGGANSARRDTTVHYALDLDNLAAGWKALAPLINGTNHPGSEVFEGKIYYIAGSHHQDKSATPQHTVEVYDPAANKWTLLADLPLARDHISSAVTVLGDRILVLGGESSPDVKTNLVSAYTPATNSWTNLTPLPATKSAGIAAVINGIVYYAGGNFATSTYKGIPVTQSNVTLSPLADAFVRSGPYAAINYGTDPTLVVKSSYPSLTRYTYLKFSLNSATSISTATLRIYGNNTENSSAISISAYGVNNDSWAETGINWNNMPSPSTTVLSSVSVNNQAKYYDLDVTNFVKAQFAGDKTVTFLIKDPAKQNVNLAFNSKENSQNRPQLIISGTGTNAPVSSIAGEINSSESTASSLINARVYPNPVNKTFNVEFGENYTGDINLQIVDPVGRIYSLGKSKVQPGSSKVEVDISKLSLRPGIYLLRIYSETGQAGIVKLTVQ